MSITLPRVTPIRPESRYERLSPEANQAIFSATLWAQRLGHDDVGPADLLLGLISAPHSDSSEVFAALKISAKQVVGALPPVSQTRICDIYGRHRSLSSKALLVVDRARELTVNQPTTTIDVLKAVFDSNNFKPEPAWTSMGTAFEPRYQRDTQFEELLIGLKLTTDSPEKTISTVFKSRAMYR